jgi:uncharacterized membrane protein YbhN (UPF0104 family)
MKRLRRHPFKLAAAGFTLAAVAVVAIAAAYGFGAFGDAWTHLHGGWLALAIAGGLLAILSYALAYRAVAHFEDGPLLRVPLVLRMVAAGFGPFTPAGGFALDKHALHAVQDDEREATVRVLGLGALEWAVLAPAACICAIVLLATGATRPMRSLLWPWAVAVPVGFVFGFWLASDNPREWLRKRDGRWSAVTHGLDAIAALRGLARSLSSCWTAWLGISLYWAFDIASFYGALRFIGLRLDLADAILAYATGYALTRRSMPLGGAGVTETLMTFALHWVGWPVASSLAAVVVYRAFNFAMPTVPALLVRPRVAPLIDTAEDGRTPARAERRRAAAPFRLPG